MRSDRSTSSPGKSADIALLAGLLLATLAGGLAGAVLFDHQSGPRSLFELANLVGPTTRSLLDGGGLTACTEGMGTPGNPICFHAARMPLASLVVGLGVLLFGDHPLPVALFKTVLLLLPLQYAIFLVWRELPPAGARRAVAVALLLAPFAITAFLADVINLQVEEGYAYSLLSLVFALVLFARAEAMRSILRAVVFALALDGLYLSKSSLAVAVVVLLAAYLLLAERARGRRGGVSALVLALTLAAPVGWALHQHHASGRYSLGTSLDGINLHKANNSRFLERYSMRRPALDVYDTELNRGLQFNDEWTFNDLHQRAALDFLREHPGATLRADLRKLSVLFLSVRKIGSAESSGGLLLLETFGLILFRLILWTALALSCLWLLKRGRADDGEVDFALSMWGAGLLFLALVAACVLPYVVGFAYTRHASILLFPAVLLCCRALVSWPPAEAVAARSSSAKRLSGGTL